MDGAEFGALHVFTRVGLVKREELRLGRLTIYDNGVVVAAELVRVLRIAAGVPDDLVLEIGLAKDGVTNHTDMVRNTGLDVDDGDTVLLEYTMTLYNAFLHKLWEVGVLVGEIVEIATGIIGWIHVDHVDRFWGHGAK